MLKTRRPGDARRRRIAREIERVYEPVVQGVTAHFHLRDEDDARDGVHTVAVRLLSKGLSRIGKWGRYLTKATVHEHRHAHKKVKIVLFSELSKDEQQRIVEEVPGPLKSPAVLVAEADWKAVIQAEISKLPPRQRAVVTLWSRDFTHKEIADTLGLKSAATSRSSLRDGLAGLERLLRARGISDCTFCRPKHSR